MKKNKNKILTQKGAAGSAKATKGRARTIESKKMYNRKQKENEERQPIKE